MVAQFTLLVTALVLTVSPHPVLQDTDRPHGAYQQVQPHTQWSEHSSDAILEKFALAARPSRRGGF